MSNVISNVLIVMARYLLLWWLFAWQVVAG